MLNEKLINNHLKNTIMKTILLTSFLLTFVFLMPARAQYNQPPSTGNEWLYQPTKIETYLYNIDKFEFGTGSGIDSIPESVTEFNYLDNRITATSSVYSDAQWMTELQTDIYHRNESMIDSMIIMIYDQRQWFGMAALKWQTPMKLVCKHWQKPMPPIH